jgi:hypothetical protein
MSVKPRKPGSRQRSLTGVYDSTQGKRCASLPAYGCQAGGEIVREQARVKRAATVMHEAAIGVIPSSRSRGRRSSRNSSRIPRAMW